MRLAFRTAWPPGIAIAGATAVLFARNAFQRGDPAMIGAQTIWLPMIVLFGLIVAWVRFREDIHAWFKESMQAAEDQRKTKTSTDSSTESSTET